MVGYDRLEQLRKAASDAPYRIKAGGRGVIVWEVQKGGIWKEIATLARVEDAQLLVWALFEADEPAAVGPPIDGI